MDNNNTNNTVEPASKKAKYTPITAGARRLPIKLKEKLPYRRLAYILINFDKGVGEKICPDAKERAKVKKTLLAYYHAVTKKKNDGGIGTITIDYLTKVIGRSYASGPALQNIVKLVRHTLTYDLYHDLDFKNAQPTLVSQYAEKHGLHLPTLKMYKVSKEEMLDDLCEKTGLSRQKAKDAIHAIMNNGNPIPGNVQAPEWITELYREMAILYKHIEQHEPEIWEQAKKKAEEKKVEGKNANVEGSALSYLYGELEAKCLMVIHDYLKREKYAKGDVMVLIYDGVMILQSQKKNFDMAKLIEELQKEVLYKTGYEIKLHEKPIPINPLQLPPDDQLGDVEISARAPEADERTVENDDQASDIFLEKIADDVRMCNGVLYVRKEGIWRCNKATVDDWLVYRCMREVNICKLGGPKGDEVRPYSKQSYGAANIIKVTRAKIPETPDFNEQVWHSSMGKMFFNDGYLDFAAYLAARHQGFSSGEAAQRAFTEGFEGTDSMFKISYDFPERNEEDIKEFWDKILYPIFIKGNEELEVWLQATARAMAGHVKDKRWMVMLGERNSGKGVLQAIKKATFGPYVGAFNLSSVKRIRGSRDGGDEAKKNSWLMTFEYKRFAESNEGGKDELDGEKIKGSMGSGGDVMQGRQNYQDEREFRVQSTFTISCNDFPNVNPSDALQTVLAFTMPRVFVAPEVYDANIIRQGPLDPNPHNTNDPSTARADNDIKDYCEEPRAAAAFLHILLEYYRPRPAKPCASMLEFREGLEAGGEDDIVDTLFEFTKNMNDMVLIKEVKDLLEKYDTLKFAKLRRIATQRNKGMKLPTDKNEKRTIEGKRGNVMYGIKILDSARQGPTNGNQRPREAYNYDYNNEYNMY